MKNQRLKVLLLVGVAGILATCLRDEFEQFEFVEVTTQAPRVINNDITLHGALNRIDKVFIREYGFILSVSDSLPSLLENTLIFKKTEALSVPTFQQELKKNALPAAPFYFIRAYAVQELPDRNRVAYGVSQRLSFALQVTLSRPQSLCSSQQAIVAGMILNRSLEKPFAQHGFVYSSVHPLPELGEGPAINLGMVSPDAPDPFTFSDTLKGLQSEIVYFVRAFALRNGQEVFYSDADSIRLTAQDFDGDGVTDDCDDDDDDDGVLDAPLGLDQFPHDNTRCGDSDLDGCDDCSVEGFFNPNNDGPDTDGDGKCDLSEEDRDNDGVPDADDPNDFDPRVCGDSDGDQCDDCAVFAFFRPNDDGPDNDGDGKCDSGDPDDDNDGVEDSQDPEPFNPSVCGDSDGDDCDDCSAGNTFAPANDGPDYDRDGLCDSGDPDDDNDNVNDAQDPDDFNRFICGDSDGDGCDDCSVLGTFAPNNDGPDANGDGICDANNTDDDNDGVPDVYDPFPDNPYRCGDSDNDGCDDCTIGTDGFGPQPDNLPFNDGPDTDGDGQCNDGDDDDDNDGVPDASDPEPNNPNRCGDSDNDGCDDCTIGVDGFGELPDAMPGNDGTDTDGDGICDTGDDDDDNDGVPDAEDVQPTNPNRCRDLDNDGCDDCTIGTDGFGPLPDFDPANDGC
ncbi:MAG: hypothetical protein H6560_15470 [Lewinellaceae bacterium]|nr:hypothetical protein [Lewinellaceae bacterium]